MKRSFLAKIMTAVTVTGAIGAGVLFSGNAHAQYGYVPPPPEYVAAYEPVYYGGHASYYYGNRWYYRDGANWRWYDREPPELYDRRIHGGWGGHYYGRPGYFHGYRR